MELVRNRLVESGWKDELWIACREEYVKKKGRKDVTVDELIRAITPKARETTVNLLQSWTFVCFSGPSLCMCSFNTRCCETRAAEQNSKLHWISCCS
ncbi:hypothetical protein Bca52824_068489 [Brassica carinata]|uniref:Transcription and mRNA export factor ENY2 n=1 Tax=Brassica carinata TaxID=52824 RepID=A0A8X7Q0V4_BRACI|nr:hypothetical protein Bca52824_068489 [Brassica carinata]